MSKIRTRKVDPSSNEAALFGGTRYTPIPTYGSSDYTPEPTYIIEVVLPDGDATPIARASREKMSGAGVNMWGSPYRWELSRDGQGDPRSRRNGILVEYFDTLQDCKEAIGILILAAFGK